MNSTRRKTSNRSPLRSERWRWLIVNLKRKPAAPIRHGIPAAADETRTAAVCLHPVTGEARIVIAARGYALIVDPVRETSEQLFFPDRDKEYPYACIGGADGTFYVGAGRLFMAIDPFRGTFRHASFPDCGEDIIGFRLAEAPDGAVYLTTYPSSLLLRYVPGAAVVETLARLDESQKYASSVACGDDGWVYAGIGTEKHNVVAYEPRTGELRSFVPEGGRRRGSGQVYRAVNGEVYGSWETDAEGAPIWSRFTHGAYDPAIGTPPPSLYTGEGFQTVHGSLPHPYKLIGVDLAEREVTVANEAEGTVRTIRLVYQSDGASLSPLTLGPDGRIYGTSNHPLHFYAYDPDTNELTDYGGKAIERGGGGNLCAYASQGTVLAGAAYAGGHFHLIDVSKPLQWTDAEQRNPKLVTSHPEIYRPRCALALSDGCTIVYGGFPGYGAVGGGLCFYNLRTGEDRLLANDRLVPFQSTLCLAELADGRLIGGTSIETPGGAEPKAKEAELYTLDPQTGTVIERWIPIAGAREISLLKAYTSHGVVGFTSEAILFRFDARTGEVTNRLDLSEWGGIVRDGLLTLADGRMIGALGGAIFLLDPVTFEILAAHRPPHPITAGLAYRSGRVYYASGSELCSIVV